MTRRKWKKSTLVAAAFFLYITATAAYLLPRNTEAGTAEKWLTVAAAYVIVALLWWVLRKREQMRDDFKKQKQ